MTLPWTDDAKARAKKDGRYLVKLHLQGRYADKGCVDFAGDVDDESAEKLKAILAGIIMEAGGQTSFDVSGFTQTPAQTSAQTDIAPAEDLALVCSELRRENGILSEQVKILEGDYDTLKAAQDHLAKHCDLARRDADSHRREAGRLKEEVKILEGDCDRLTAENNRLTAVISLAASRVYNLNEEDREEESNLIKDQYSSLILHSAEDTKPRLVTGGSVTQAEEIKRLQQQNARLESVMALAAARVVAVEHEKDARHESDLIAGHYKGWIPGDSCRRDFCKGTIRDDGFCDVCETPLVIPNDEETP